MLSEWGQQLHTVSSCHLGTQHLMVGAHPVSGPALLLVFLIHSTRRRRSPGAQPHLSPSKYKAENLQTWWYCVRVAKGILPRLLQWQQRTASPGLVEDLESGQVDRGCFMHKQTSWRHSGCRTCKLCCPCLAGWLWALWYEARQGCVEEGAVTWSTWLHPSAPGRPSRDLTLSTSESPRNMWLEIPLPQGCPLGCFQATVIQCLQEVQLRWLDSELTFSSWAGESKGNRWDRQKAFP